MADDPNAVFTAMSNAELWIQPGGPNTKPYYLGCHDLGDLSAPEGGITLIQCFDGRGGWVTRGVTKTAPEPATANIGTYYGKTLAWIEKIRCPATLFVLMRECGNAGVFGQWVRALILDLQNIATRNYTGLVNKSEDQVAMVTVDAEFAPPLIHGFRLTPVRQSIVETTALNAIASCTDGRCSGPCGGQLEAGEVLIAVGDALTASPGNLAQAWLSENSGGTWAAAAASPFAGGLDIGAVACFPVGRNTTRRLVTRGETVGGSPAMVAISDDEGATWTTVAVGSVNAQFFPGPHALFALDYAHIWAVTDDGYIYFSGDGGETWSAQETAVIVTTDLRAVVFLDESVGYAVGDADAVLRTYDGGETWSDAGATGTGDGLLTAWVTGDGRLWVGTDDGELYYSDDRGDTFTQRAFTGDAVGEVKAIQFANELIGFMLHNTAAPVGYVLMTIDGGYSWERLTLVTNAGLNDLAVVNERLAYAVGEVSGGTGVILKVAGG